MLYDVVKKGQNFYYSVNVEFEYDTSLFGSRDYNAIAQRVALAASAFGSARVVGAGDTNITLSITSNMDRASEQDIKGNLDAIVASQPEVNALHGSMIRLTDAGLNPTTPGGLNTSSISPAMWAVIGIGLFLILKR